MIRHLLIILCCLLPLLQAPSARANDISNSTWSEVDSSNNHASPNGWTSGNMLPSQVEPTARGMMGAIKRFYNHINPTITSAGTANAQTLTYSVAPSAYVTGDVYTFLVGSSLTNTGAATLNINSLGAIAVQNGGQALVGGELAAGKYVSVTYDGTNFQIVTPPTISGAFPGSFGTTPINNGGFALGTPIALSSQIPQGVLQGQVGTMTVPSGYAQGPWPSTIRSHYLDNQATASGPTAIADFGVTLVDGGSNSQSWSTNYVLSNTDLAHWFSGAGSGKDFTLLVENECNPNIWTKSAAGTPAGEFDCLRIVGGGNVLPSGGAYGIHAFPLALATGVKWTSVLYTEDGTSGDTAIRLGPSAATAANIDRRDAATASALLVGSATAQPLETAWTSCG
jgi:hypothetical protein